MPLAQVGPPDLGHGNGLHGPRTSRESAARLLGYTLYIHESFSIAGECIDRWCCHLYQRSDAVDKRDQQINIRASEQEIREIRHAAEELKMTPSELLRKGALAYHKNRIAMRRANADRQRHHQDPSK
jgi:hypothetical protein